MLTCPKCGKSFDPADRASPSALAGSFGQIKYCSKACKRSRNNQNNYIRRLLRKLSGN